MRERNRLIEKGKGYWCYEIVVYENHPPMADNPDDVSLSCTSDYSTQLVHRPVSVDVTDDGEAYAYYFDVDADPMYVCENGGKRYVPLDQVHLTPLPGSEPAYKHD